MSNAPGNAGPAKIGNENDQFAKILGICSLITVVVVAITCVQTFLIKPQESPVNNAPGNAGPAKIGNENDRFAKIAGICSLITVVVAAITCVQTFLIKWQEDNIKVQQDGIKLQQDGIKLQQDGIKLQQEDIALKQSAFKLKQDEISEQLKRQSNFVADISNSTKDPKTLPLILSYYPDKNAALQASLNYPEGGYVLAQNLVASATDRKTAKEMGVIQQANRILAQLSDQLHLQREESYARHKEFMNLAIYAVIQVLGQAGQSFLESLHGFSLSPSMLGKLKAIVEDDGDPTKFDPAVLNSLVREKLTKAGDKPLFSPGVLKQLVSRAKRLIEQSTSPIYEEIVDPEFIERMKKVLKQVDDVSGKLDTAKPEELNRLALKLNDIYDDLAPTISQTKKESEDVIKGFELFISQARPDLELLERGDHVPPPAMNDLERAYDAAIRAATIRNAKRIDSYKSKAVLVINVIRMMDRLN